MFHFLVELQRQTKSDDLAGLLGSIVINETDDIPVDPAMWDDWQDSVQKVILQK